MLAIVGCQCPSIAISDQRFPSHYYSFSLENEIKQLSLTCYSQEVEATSPKRGIRFSFEIVALTHNLRNQPADEHQD